MDYITIKDGFSFLKKSKIKASEGKTSGLYPFYTSSNILSKYLDEYEIENEALIFGTGGNASIHYSKGLFSTSTDCFVIQSNNKYEIVLKYVYYFLSGNIYILENGFKGAGLKHISKKYLENIKIPLPPLQTQEKIVKVLDKAQELIDLRKKQIELLDELMISLLINDVGPKAEKYDEWEKVQIKDLALKKKSSIRTGPFGSDLLHSEFVSEGIYVLGIDNVVTNRFKWGKERYITEEKFEKLKRYRVYPDDVLISIMGTTGRSAVVPQNIPLAINSKHLACITPNKDLVNPYFLSLSIHSNPMILMQIELRNKGAIMNGLNLTIIKELNIKLPPIKLQNEFAYKIQKIEEQKELIQKSLFEMENNFNSLMQKAFKGDLFRGD
ncbi:restriction endonuclease S subunit [Gottschalkia purinilytica]|uniref:Restriction endonuclease S subunit n=1 Tax=Gottschalkia purinilytica TaxID=1503 RepID=A0A0L0WEQ1_GOTPU|nr:restriction endonuclease subunit S [Gottschalkia purinilytica]KNF09944.1 restriction endonuclease S subunit [Gottschalkia purinilytica]